MMQNSLKLTLENSLTYLLRLGEEVFGTLLPKPNLIINLGSGLHLVWLINPVLPLWSVVQDYFYIDIGYVIFKMMLIKL